MSLWFQSCPAFTVEESSITSLSTVHPYALYVPVILLLKKWQNEQLKSLPSFKPTGVLDTQNIDFCSFLVSLKDLRTIQYLLFFFFYSKAVFKSLVVPVSSVLLLFFFFVKLFQSDFMTDVLCFLSLGAARWKKQWAQVEEESSADAIWWWPGQSSLTMIP